MDGEEEIYVGGVRKVKGLGMPRYIDVTDSRPSASNEPSTVTKMSCSIPPLAALRSCANARA